MANQVSTTDFLPEIFKTKTNEQFLKATLDQLIQQPDFSKIQGYIGSKFGYGVEAADAYVNEPTTIRKNYQLEPAVVFKKTDTNIAIDALTYPGLLDGLAVHGAVTDNHNSLFKNEFYSWDSFADLDKIINYSQYYWLPQGPESVNISTENIYSNGSFTIASDGAVYDVKSTLYTFDVSNPTITLVRGGSYDFIVNQDTNFFVQTEPGITGFKASRPNISTRSIYGINDNGLSHGTITFNVPLANAQDIYNFPGNIPISLATTKKFTDIYGKPLSELLEIDGVTSLNGKTLLFYGSNPTDVEYIGGLYDNTVFDDNPIIGDYDEGVYTTVNNNYYVISLVGDPLDPVVILNEAGVLPSDQKITVLEGKEYISRNFVRNSDGNISLIPIITANLDTLYYQDSVNSAKFGKIKLIDQPSNNNIEIANIIGQPNYTSPNGVKFTNGLKVQFVGNIIPHSYTQDQYYVEGVGTSITLLPVTEQLVPEPFGQSYYTPYDTTAYDVGSYGSALAVPLTPDYITINRNSISKNAWSRSNRWFHADVLNTVLSTNTTSPLVLAALNDPAARAKRPIIEFYPNLKLFDSGTTGIAPVDFINFDVTDAFNQVAGTLEFKPDGVTTELYTGARIIFAGDKNPDVANKIFVADVANVQTAINTQKFIYDGVHHVFTLANGMLGNNIFSNIVEVNGKTLNSINDYVINEVTNQLIVNSQLINNTDSIVITTYRKPSITLSKASDGDVSYNQQTVITKGEKYQGISFYYDGITWVQSQFKQKVNQPPLFDVFDSNGLSFGDRDFYSGTDFKGSTLFEYAKGSGVDDIILGFPIKYSSITNLGDITFNVSLNSQTFNYVVDSKSINAPIGTGYVYSYTSATGYDRQIGWQTAIETSFQYQIFNLVSTSSNIYFLDIPVKDTYSTNWPPVVVYLDNQRQDPSSYEFSSGATSTIVTFVTSPAVGIPIEILIYSDNVSATGYYQIPSNFDHNPFNTAITSINMGDIRGHYKSICNNVSTFTGYAFGANNFRDLGNLIPYGNRIIQNSASMTAAAVFLRAPNANFFTALSYNSQEYTKYKALLMNTIDNTDYDVLTPISDILDDAIEQLVTIKTESNSFFYSDMLPARNVYTEKTYSFKSGINTSNYPLSKIYDFKTANYFGILVYLTRVINGVRRTIQLVKDVDYTISDSAPKLTIVKPLLLNDSVTIKEYTQTYGNFVPNTPTKLGLYPATIPQVILDSSYMTPTYFIVGHDGSYTKVYGDVTDDGYLIDFKDRSLLEFETRIYNNLKVNAKIPLELDDIMPGQFRQTDYTHDQLLKIYSTQFLNWVGLNRIDYSTQHYDKSKEYTWNYNKSINKLTNTVLAQGNWRGVYLWLYDTSNPDSKPWEMLGLANKPLWWDSHYGPAPYTSDNLLLWTDISRGYVWNNNHPYVNSKRARPGLLSILPVDSTGALVSPFASIVNSYDVDTFNNNWMAGDVGPAEYSYLKSSTWPFDLMRMFALTKPAEFFTLGLDLDTYKYNTEFGQYLVNNRSRKPLSDIVVYGGGVNNAAHSYLNWVVDNINQYGTDGSQYLSNCFKNLDVNLAYRMAGYSDKEFLNFYIEKGSPNSTNNSLLIPSENYSILLYENQPYNKIMFSSIIIQKTTNGFKVYGNSQDKAYFTISNPILNGAYDTITISGLTANVSKNYYPTVSIIPYGTEFTGYTELSQFIKSYGQFLTEQGVQFTNLENAIELNWNQMIAEILYWISSGWEVGSTVNVNPCANSITIDTPNGIVQSLTMNQDNYMLNQNAIPVKIQDLAIYRSGTTFSATALNQGESLSFMQASLSDMEHIVIFDNMTIFNDALFVLETGLRQQRIFVRGNKTNNWDGTLNAPGFLVNQTAIADWQMSVKYVKGEIVSFKNNYWMALSDTIAPNLKFNPEQWLKIQSTTLTMGFLPNPSTRAFESILYYDSNQANLKNDADLLSFSLIGYRPRPYLAEANFTDTTQINFYKTMIESKGTLDSFNMLQGANIQQSTLDYKLHENWAIKSSDFGGVLNKNFIEITLDENQLTGNPAVVGIINGQDITGLQQEVALYNIKNYNYSILDTNILPTIPSSSDNLLPDAGYVNIGDINIVGYNLARLDNNTIPYLYNNDYIWLADYLGKWNVYTPIPTGINLVKVANNLNNTCTLTFNKPHTLSNSDLFGVLNFDRRINGYYAVLTVVDLYNIVITLTLNSSTTSIVNSGLLFKLQSQRVSTAKDIINLPLLNSEYFNNLVWVDKNPDGEWNVYKKSNNYTFNVINNVPTLGKYGTGIAYDKNLGYFVTDVTTGKLFRYIETSNKSEPFALESITVHGQNFGTCIVKNNNIMIVSKPDPFGDLSQFYVYRFFNSDRGNAVVEEQIITIAGYRIGDSMALSGDGNYLYLSMIDVNAIVAYQQDKDYKYTDVGITISTAITPGSTSFVCSGNLTSVILAGKFVSFTDQGYDQVYSIVTSQYNSDTNTTTFYTVETIAYSIASGTSIYIASISYSLLGAVTSEGLATGGDLFSRSLATNYDGTKLFVGAPMKSFNDALQNNGYAFVFDRLVENWRVTSNSYAGSFTLFFMPWQPTVTSNVYVNGIRLPPSYYVIISNLLILGPMLLEGDLVTVSSGNFVLTQELASFDTIADIHPGQQFGYSLDCNQTGSELIVSSPFDLNKTTGQEGSVYRYTSEGKRFGVITGILTCDLLASAYILINGYGVSIPAGNAFAIATAINQAIVTNVFAYATEDGRLIIRLRDHNLSQVNNKLTITVFDGNVLTELGIVEYIKTQVILDPHVEGRTQFGHTVKFNEFNSFVVSAPVTNRYLGTHFDFVDSNNQHNDTVFDNNFTTWEDSFSNAGSVYMYDYIPSYNESLLTAGNYIYAQACNDLVTDYGSQPYYGQTLAFNDNKVVIGTPNFKPQTVGGRVVVYENLVGKPDWSIHRKSSIIVDINQVQKIQVYNNTTDINIDSLDYFDPLQGKLLGPIKENIDFITTVDPAGYNNPNAFVGNIVWGQQQVGKIWFDMTNTKFINYHQDDLVYNSNYWGNVFPGSNVTVYSWIESSTPPASYTGSGTPYNINSYSIGFITDASDNLIPMYYYWVRNSNILFSLQGKTLTDAVLEQYIANPQNSGISYFAALAPNVFALYNSGDYIKGTKTNLHIGFSTNSNDVPNHTEFQLIRNNYPDDFLTGVPDGINYLVPQSLYAKLLHSLAGVDDFGQIMPNPYLPKLLQIGIGTRPNQTMFGNRLLALQNYLEYANNILKQYPVSEFENITFMGTTGEFYDTKKYWSPIYWYAPGYSTTTKTAYEVASYHNLLAINAYEGLIVGVTANGGGKREIYLYTVGTWTRIAVEDGTIQFLSTLWDYQTNKIGFGDNFFDSELFDSYPSTETYYIIRALNEQIYTGPLYAYRNSSLILLFEYIQSENVAANNYMPWLNKTSLADVTYNVRQLIEYPKFQRDNENLLAGFLDEIKPYHVVLKEFYYNYSGNDNYNGNISDFDLPATYDTTVNRFISPKIIYGESGGYDDFVVSDTIWNTSDYKSWFANYGLTLTPAPTTEVATLLKYLTNVGQTIQVDNARGLPVLGTLKIDNELISYTNVNRETGVLTGLSRGVNGTPQANHYPNTIVYMDLPAVVVLDASRNYIDPPQVTAYIDTSIYPAPRTPAKLKAVMSGDRVIGVSVIDPGDGYIVQPEIQFQSSLDITFTDSAINHSSNLLVLNTNQLVTGDLIKLTLTQLTPIAGIQFITPNYYYVRVLSNDGVQSTITLHTTYSQSLTGDHRVIFKINTVLGDYSCKISLTPRAIPITINSHVREMTTTLRFDRTSYESMIVPWKSGEFWPSPFVDYGNKASSDPLLSTSTPYLDPSSSISSAHGRGISFTVENILYGASYGVIINYGGLGFAVNDTILVKGSKLGGVDGTGGGNTGNDCLITITSVSTSLASLGAVLTATASGIPVIATNPNVASLQGALLPITGVINDNDTAIVSVNYVPSTLKPGQVKGLGMYFYRIYPPYIYDDTLAGGAKIQIARPNFTPNSITNQYYMLMLNAGSIYKAGDSILIKGSLLGGVDGVNDALITIKYAGDDGSILISNITGVAVGNYQFYYVNPVTNTELKVYTDAKLNYPVAFSDFIYNGIGYKDYGYLPEPLIITGASYKYNVSAVVSYNNKVWRCVESNSDLIFDYTKWQEIPSSDRSLNALDRIIGYYTPTLNMPGKDLTQLLEGITYPDNVYYGNSFAPGEELPLDFVIQDQPFYPRDIDIKSIVFDGMQYVAVGESATHSVALISSDGKNWTTTKLSNQNLGVTDITYHNTYYIVTTTNLINPILLSFDTENWITVGTYTPYDSFGLDENTGFDGTSLSCPPDSLYSIIHVNNKYFATGNDILYSNDGLIWNQTYSFGSQLTHTIKNIAYVNAHNFVGYIAVGSGDTVISGANTASPTIVYASKMITSIDGLNWKLSAVPISSNGLNAIAASSNIIVTVGDMGEIWYSINSLNWIRANIAGSAVTASLQSIVYSQGMFIVVGDSGTILVSSDGINYTQLTSNEITIHNLNKVTSDGTYFYIVGNKGIVFRSANGMIWSNLSFIQTPDSFYSIKGSDFLYGYGPEELVAGVVTDNINIRVNTMPGAFWDNDIYTQTGLFQHTGFNMISRIYRMSNNLLTVNFDNLVENPAQLSVYIVDNGTKLGKRIYENIAVSANNTHTYQVNWVNKTITLNQPIDNTQALLVEVYEIGNGRQYIRSNTQAMPMSIDLVSNNSKLSFEVKYETLATAPIIYHNGTKLIYQTDYTVSSDGIGYFQIIFNTVYDPKVDYLSFALLGNTINEYNTSNQYSYSIPETELFTFDGIFNTFNLTNFVDEDDAVNSIVEVNGYRLIPATDYVVDGSLSKLIISKQLVANDLVSITTFNDTRRQYLSTTQSTTLQVDSIYYIDNTVSPVRMTLATNPNFIDGTAVKIDGTDGSIELNGNVLYVKAEATYTVDAITYYPYRLYNNSALTSPFNGIAIHAYSGNGYVWANSQTIAVVQPNVTLTDGSRTWVTVNGQRLDPSMVKFGSTNYINILAPIDLGDNVVVTSTISTATPNSLSFAINVDKHNNAKVYTSNTRDRTWLTQDLIKTEDTIYLENVRNLVDITTEQYTVIEENSKKIVYVDQDMDVVREVIITDIDSLYTLSKEEYLITLINHRHAIVFTDSSVAADDVLEISFRVGDIIQIGAEKIRFGAIDYVNNTISNLTRGVDGTGKSNHLQNTYVYGITDNRILDEKYYNILWNSSDYKSISGVFDPLQISSSVPARFLQSGTY